MSDNWPVAIEWVATVLAIAWIWTTYAKRGGDS